MKIEKRSIIKFSIIIITIIAGIAAYFIFLSNADLQHWKNVLLENKALAIFVILSLYILKPFLMFLPTSLQLVFTSIVFPWYWAIAINTLGMALEMASGYYIGKFFGKDFVGKIVSKSKKAQMISDKYIKDNFEIIFITHFVPIFPFDIISMLYGANGSNFPNYLWVSMFGLAPRIIAFTISGDAIGDPLSAQFLLPMVVIGGLSLIGTIWFRRKNATGK